MILNFQATPNFMRSQPYIFPSLSHIHARPKNDNFVQQVWLGYIAFIIIYAALFSIWQTEPVPSNVHFLGVVVAALCVLPLAMWAAGNRREIPMFELICVAYLLAFSLPIYLLPNQTVIDSQIILFSWTEMAGALLLVLLGVFTMISGYYMLRWMPGIKNLPHLDLPLRPHGRATYLKVALTIGFILAVFTGVGVSVLGGPLQAFVRVFSNQIYIGIVLLAYQVFREPSRQGTVVLYGVVLLSSTIGLTSGMLENALIPLILLFIVRWHTSRKLPLRWLFVGTTMLIVLNSAKMDYREQVWSSGENKGIGDRIRLWVSLGSISADAAKANANARTEIFQRTVSRFDLLHQFMWLRAKTPHTIPFYNGQTYNYILYGWIPRALWPDKPIAQEANILFAIDYGLLSQEQTSSTMIGIGHLPEAYANFGNIGVALAMLLQGIFFASINRIMNGPYSDGGRAIYLSVMVFFLNGIGTNAATIFMSVIPNILASALILRLCSTCWTNRYNHSANLTVNPTPRPQVIRGRRVGGY